MYMLESDRLLAVLAHRKRIKRIRVVKKVVSALFLYAIMVFFGGLIIFVH